MFGIPDMWFALGLVLIFALMGAGLGVGLAVFLVKSGLWDGIPGQSFRNPITYKEHLRRQQEEK